MKLVYIEKSPLIINPHTHRPFSCRWWFQILRVWLAQKALPWLVRMRQLCKWGYSCASLTVPKKYQSYLLNFDLRSFLYGLIQMAEAQCTGWKLSLCIYSDTQYVWEAYENNGCWTLIMNLGPINHRVLLSRYFLSLGQHFDSSTLRVLAQHHTLVHRALWNYLSYPPLLIFKH